MLSRKESLRIESSLNCSGKIFKEGSIPLLKERDYIVEDVPLDGDAPKQFIKAYFYEQDGRVRKSSLQSWNSYIAKTAEKWYPHESIVEYMINRIGQELGLNMNEIRLVRANGQIRFLSKYFLQKNDRLIHGAELCGEYLNDMPMAEQIAKNKNTARELFTFEFITDSIRTVFPNNFENILADLVRTITFDAIVGNNDRHFYNWGVITSKKKTTKLPIFAPIYDSARGLFWNESDEQIKTILKLRKQGGKKIEKYVQEACPRISIGGNTKANHFELIDFVKRHNKEYETIVNSISCVENEVKVLEMLRKEFFPFFINERKEVISLIIKTRFEKIRSL